MGEFVNEEFVTEFSCRTLANYYFLSSMKLSEEYELCDEISKHKSGKILLGSEELKNKERKVEKLRKHRIKMEQEYDALLSKMMKKGYKISNYYEVTLLINSLIGLLVFPEQKYEYQIRDRITNYGEMKILSKIMNREGSYASSYTELDKGTPYSMIRHIKNSLSHQNVMVFPISISNKSEEHDVTHVIFSDFNPRRTRYNPTDGSNILEEIYVLYDKGCKNYVLKNNHVLVDAYNNGYPEFAIVVPVDELEELVLEISSAIIQFGNQ